MRFFEIYRKWKEGFIPIKTFLWEYYPLEVAYVGMKSYACDDKRIKTCKALCCALNVYVSPLDIAPLSFLLQLPPSSFIEIEKPSFLLAGKESKVWNLFRIKKKDGKCLFNDPQSFKCKIYEKRPIACGVYPFSYVPSIGLVQKKGCPGFKKGKKLTKEEIDELTKIAKVAYLSGSLAYNVNQEAIIKEKFEEEGKRISKMLGIEWNSVVKNLDLIQLVGKLYSISNLKEELEEINFSEIELEKMYKIYYLKNFNKI